MNKTNRYKIILIDSIIILLAIVNAVFIYNNVVNKGLKITLIVGTVILVILYFLFVVTKNLGKPLEPRAQENNTHKSPLTVIALIGEEGQVIKEWDLMNRVTMLIGRSTKKQEVDIDLTSCTYASLVEHEHAILNFAAEKWYIEDLYSKNGISIQKEGDKIKYKLSQDRPCQISKGDIIYIGKTKLLVK